MRGPAGVLLAFCGWMLLSTMWATLSSYTLIESVSLFVTCLAGLYIARSFTLFQQLSLFLVGMQPGLVVSWFAVRNNWSLSVLSENGAWIGIYFNRNSLAPPAALGLLAAVALLRIVVRRRTNWLFALLLLAVSVLDATLLFRSESSTSLGAIVVFGIVWIFWSMVHLLERQKTHARPKVTNCLSKFSDRSYFIYLDGRSLPELFAAHNRCKSRLQWTGTFVAV